MNRRMGGLITGGFRETKSATWVSLFSEGALWSAQAICRRAQTQQPFMYNYCQYLPSSKCNAISFIEDINRITVIWATAVKFIGTLWCIWIWMYNCAVKVEQEKENQFVFLESFAKINQTMKYSKHKQSLCILSRFNLFSESLKR